ncbi:hypothetical protein PMAYCL1PPCAC_08559, partial [Pristionchus mayeri]
MSFLLLRSNRQADRIECNLCVRYQVKENLKILRVFAPLAALCVVWQTLTFLLFIVPFITADDRLISLASALFLLICEFYPLSVSSALLFSSAFGSPLRFKCWRRKESKVEPE